ncbi:hypothetical protein NSR98_25615, partial [Salmonella enterica]|nr:hypothetical protein [Salmonella enterica]
LGEFEALIRTLEATKLRPSFESVPFEQTLDGFARLWGGEVTGKLVVTLLPEPETAPGGNRSVFG